jgi:DNA polymerase IV
MRKQTSDARKIIHLDLDAFFCAVEELKNPELFGKAFAVGGRPEQRGVVASCSYPARGFGVHSAMPMAQALRICPNLIIVSSRYSEYSSVSKQMMERLFDLSPLVEQISIDEAFIDVSEINSPVEFIASKLQSRINQELNLPCSLGVAGNKLVAKIATDFGKTTKPKDRPPNVITCVEPGKEAEFLAPLSVGMLWGVGPKTSERLNNLGIITIGDLAKFPKKELIRIFGKNGHDLSLHAIGIDDSPITTTHEPKSISQETTFSKDIRDPVELKRVLYRLSERVGKRLREENLTGATIKIKLRWSDFTTLTRQLTTPIPTNKDKEIFQAAYGLFQKTWEPGRPVRLIGVGVSGFTSSIHQLELWGSEDPNVPDKGQQLQTALDRLRDRFGHSVIQRASDLKKTE